MNLDIGGRKAISVLGLLPPRHPLQPSPEALRSLDLHPLDRSRPPVSRSRARSLGWLALALALFAGGCGYRWLDQAQDDDPSNVPLLTITPEMTNQPTIFDVQVHAAAGQSWGLGVRLTAGVFFDGPGAGSVQCRSITTLANGTFDLLVTLAAPLSGTAALLAELTPIGRPDAATDPHSICGGAAPVRYASWPLNAPVVVQDAGLDRTLDAAPHDGSGQ